MKKKKKNENQKMITKGKLNSPVVNAEMFLY